jgi:hypothetical protein
MTLEAWLTNHPYIQPLADLHVRISDMADENPVFCTFLPPWTDYSDEFHAGIPLLRSSTCAIALLDAADVVTSLVRKVAAKRLPGRVASEAQTLDAELHAARDSDRRGLASLIDTDSFPSAHLGLFHYLGWISLSRYLRPLIAAFHNWRDEEGWLLNYCPTCGALPAMAVGGGRFRASSPSVVWSLCRTLVIFAQRMSVLRNTR